ncbi:MAG TPA: hypothetical protein PK992_10555, partial [Planctomycetaceae bacterium]|nr:hypothetical protein [Planctomycetaceae bacterium]
GGAVISQVSGKASVEVSSITTTDLATLLAIGTNTFISVGLYIASGTITIPGKVRAAGGLFAAGSSHVGLAGTDALIVPTTIEASQDSDFATGGFDIHWLSNNGLTKGCDDATGAALGTQAFGSEYALGPCYINATLIAGVQSFRVTPGFEITKPPLGSGAIFPTQAMIKKVEPTIQITVNDFAAIAGTIGDWTEMTSANCYLRKRADKAVYSATTDNIRFTFAAGLTDTDSFDIANNDDGSATITLHGKALTASAAVAIP